MFLTEEAK